MKIVVIIDDRQKFELHAEETAISAEIIWQEAPGPALNAEAYIDLMFDGNPERVTQLKGLSPALIVVNAVEYTTQQLSPDFVRINGWPGFLNAKIIEAYSPEHLQQKTSTMLTGLGRKPEWIADIPGFVTPRVVSMIINEAYFALEEDISTKEQIDIAMKLGTNYPYGPFEWGRKIGLRKIYNLLKLLSKEESRYNPSSLLETEALSS